MSKGVSKAIIIGTIGRDPEVHYAQNGKPMCTLSVAVDQQWKTADGEPRQEVAWFRCVLLGQHATFAGEYASKGRQVYVDGRLQNRKWQDKQGNERWTTEVVALDFKLLGNKPGNGNRQRETYTRPQAQPEQVAQMYADEQHFERDEVPF